MSAFFISFNQSASSQWASFFKYLLLPRIKKKRKKNKRTKKEKEIEGKWIHHLLQL